MAPPRRVMGNIRPIGTTIFIPANNDSCTPDAIKSVQRTAPRSRTRLQPHDDERGTGLALARDAIHKDSVISHSQMHSQMHIPATVSRTRENALRSARVQ